MSRQEFVIGGYTEPQGSRKGFGSLLIGFYEKDGLHYAGKVGTGFNNEILADLHEQMQKLETQKDYLQKEQRSATKGRSLDKAGDGSRNRLYRMDFY